MLPPPILSEAPAPAPAAPACTAPNYCVCPRHIDEHAAGLWDPKPRPCVPPSAARSVDLALVTDIARWIAAVDAAPAHVAASERHAHRPTPRSVSHALALYLAEPVDAAARALGDKLAAWAAACEDGDFEGFGDAETRALELSLRVTPAACERNSSPGGAR